MTRAQIKSRAVRLAFRQGVSPIPMPDNPVEDPVMLNEDLESVIAEICRTSDECYLFYTQDIVANQARYCPAPLIQLDGATVVLDSNRGDRLLPIYAATEFKKLFPYYLTTIPVSDPCYLVYEGKSEWLLYPTPIFSMAAGLIVRGIGFYDPASWSADTAQCPLPPDQHECICHGLAARIAIAPNIRNDEMAQYTYLKGHIESEIANFTDRSRNRSGPYGRGAATGTPGDPFANPLNL